MQYRIIRYRVFRVLLNTNTNEGVLMSNIKNTGLQPANTVDELFTELTNEELSQVSGGGFSLSDFLKDFNFSYNDGETTVLVSDGNVDVKTPSRS